MMQESVAAVAPVFARLVEYGASLVRQQGGAFPTEYDVGFKMRIVGDNVLMEARVNNTRMSFFGPARDGMYEELAGRLVARVVVALGITVTVPQSAARDEELLRRAWRAQYTTVQHGT